MDIPMNPSFKIKRQLITEIFAYNNPPKIVSNRIVPTGKDSNSGRF